MGLKLRSVYTCFSKKKFHPTARVDFWISWWSFKWLSNSLLCPSSRHEVDLLRYSSIHIVTHESLSWGYARRPRHGGAFPFSSSLLTLKNETCMMKQFSPCNVYPNSKSCGTCLKKWETTSLLALGLRFYLTILYFKSFSTFYKGIFWFWGILVESTIKLHTEMCCPTGFPSTRLWLTEIADLWKLMVEYS